MTTKLLKSNDVSSTIKAELLDHFDKFIPPESPEVLRAAGEAAMYINHTLTHDQVTRIVQGDRNGAFAVQLVHHYRKDLTTLQALEAVAQAEGEYAQLTTPGAALTFPNDAPHRAFFKRLEAAEYVTHEVFTKKLLAPNPRIDVKVLSQDQE